MCKTQDCNSAKGMFSDNPSISIVECKDDGTALQVVSELTDITHSFLSGIWIGNYEEIDDQFYDQLGFPREIKTEFAYFHSSE